MAAPGPVHLQAGASTRVQLAFRVETGFHVNSNKPRSEFLIPTRLQLNAPSPLTVVEVRYPAGQDVTFPFSPNEKLNVYSGDFSINVLLKAAAATSPGTYPVAGELQFQACDKSACYPPRTLPIKFQVTVSGK